MLYRGDNHNQVCSPKNRPAFGRGSSFGEPQGTNQKPDSSPIARERAQKRANEIPRSIVALDLEGPSPIRPAPASRLVIRRDASSFFNCAIRGALSDEQVRNLSRIVQHPGHDPCGQQRNLFAVHSTPEEAPFASGLRV